ncbi:MAG: MFS transporter [Alphaproteobacteria bacterium]|nr:MFS transporter [Alphaproteobacteria bacterium]MCW5744430.1 MFS transporter [Alphaproteobacteria bacterium]
MKDEEERWRARDLLASRDFVRLWLAGGFANAMRWLELLAAGLFAYEITGSGLAAAAVAAARQLPQLLFGAFAGAVAESVNRKHVFLAALLVPASISAILATLAAFGHLALWHVVLGGLVSGTMWSTEMSTRRRMVGEAAGPQRIVQAIALDSTTGAATRMVGPLLGGIAFELLGMAGAYGLSAAVQLVCGVAMLGFVYAQETRRLALGRIATDIAAGLRFARTNALILLVYAITIVVNAFAFCYSGLIAPIGSGEFKVSPTLVGILAAAEPVGALAGGLVLASGMVRVNRRLAFVGGSSLFFVALVVMAISPSYWLAVAVLVLGGIGTAGFGNMQSTLMLTEAPPEMRSRLMGIVTVCIGTGPLGVLLAGVLADASSPREAVMIMALVGLALTVALSAKLRAR